MNTISREFGNFEFTHTGLAGVTLITPKVRGDERGFFLETYQKNTFVAAGITADFVQDNHSSSRMGTLRGLHLQLPPNYQEKIVRAIRGNILDVAVQVYPENSPDFGKMVVASLSSNNHQQLHIGESKYLSEPVLFAHGFYVTSDQAEVVYKTSKVYSPKDETGLNPFDTDISDNIFLGLNPIQMLNDGMINARDANWPNLEKLASQIWARIPERRVVVPVKKYVKRKK